MRKIKLLLILTLTTYTPFCFVMNAPNGRDSRILKKKSKLDTKQQGRALAAPVKVLIKNLKLSSQDKSQLRTVLNDLTFQSLVGVGGPKLSKKEAQVYNRVKQIQNDVNVSFDTFKEFIASLISALQ